MELARERRNVCCQRPSATAHRLPWVSWLKAPWISMASSCSRWWPSTHIILPAEASGPGSSPLSSLVIARAPVYLKTSVSIQSWASFWRITGSCVTGIPFFLLARAMSTRPSSAMRRRTCRPKPRARRSYMRVVRPTAQPLLSPPRICDSGTRTLSK